VLTADEARCGALLPADTHVAPSLACAATEVNGTLAKEGAVPAAFPRICRPGRRNTPYAKVANDRSSPDAKAGTLP
jgi:hypothetical protein